MSMTHEWKYNGIVCFIYFIIIFGGGGGGVCTCNDGGIVSGNCILRLTLTVLTCACCVCVFSFGLITVISLQIFPCVIGTCMYFIYFKVFCDIVFK